MELTLGLALLAGSIPFLSPCVLPVVPACLGQLRATRSLWVATHDMGLALIAVNVQESAGVAGEYAATYGLTCRIALDPTAAVFRAWGVFGLPPHDSIGRDGRIKDRWFGPMSLDRMQQRITLIERT